MTTESISAYAIVDANIYNSLVMHVMSALLWNAKLEKSKKINIVSFDR